MNVTVASQALTSVGADALAVNVFEGESVAGGRLAALDELLQGAITRAIDLGEVTGKLYSTTVIPTAGAITAPRLVAVGAGKRGEFDQNRARNVAGATVRALTRRPIESLAVWFTGDNGGESFADSIVSGALLASFDPGNTRRSRTRITSPSRP